MLEGQSNSQVNDAAVEQAADQAAAAKARFVNRRRLLKAAAIAAPLMITLRGKPAHAQLSSLGSAGILYGPGAYVTQQDINANPTVLSSEDLGKAVKMSGNQKIVISDKTRRDQNSTETVTVDGPDKGSTKAFQAN